MLSESPHWLRLVVALSTLRYGVLAYCPQGFFELNGICVQQATSCPPTYVLFNGACYQAISGTCPNTQISVNGQCCSQDCIQRCQTQVSCSCCGHALQVGNSPCPTAVAPAQPCHNQPVASCPNQPAAPCPNQFVSPCPNQSASPCPHQPATPCPNQPIAPTPNQPVVPCPNQPISPTPNQPVAPCPTQPVAPCPTLPVTPSTTTTTSSPETIYHTTTTTTTPLPPPDAITRCPDGTVLIKGVCRLIYCGKGIYKNNRCIQTECPEGTVWTGHKCALPEPIVETINLKNNVLTQFNFTAPDIIVNNVNNHVLNNTINVGAMPPASSTRCAEGDNEENHCDDSAESELPPQSTPALPPPEKKCCTVYSPRLCKPNASGTRWNCYNKHYRRCGDFCTAPKIILKAPEPRYTKPFMVMPPNSELGSCRQESTCAESYDRYDCSGCALGVAERCAAYCYQYACSSRSCAFYDQQQYCGSSPGGYGCQQEDGCVDEWCSGGY